MGGSPEGVGDRFRLFEEIFRLNEVGVIGAMGDEKFFIAFAVDAHDLQPAAIASFLFVINFIPRIRF